MFRGEIMGKIVIQVLGTILLFTSLLAPAIIGGTIESTYYIGTKVVAIEGDEVLIVDEDGEEWVFCSDDFSVGDKVKVRFFTKGTDNTRFDD